MPACWSCRREGRGWIRLGGFPGDRRTGHEDHRGVRWGSVRAGWPEDHQGDSTVLGCDGRRDEWTDRYPFT